MNQNLPIGNVLDPVGNVLDPVGNFLDPVGIALDLMSWRWFSSYCYFEASLFVLMKEGQTDTGEVF